MRIKNNLYVYLLIALLFLIGCFADIKKEPIRINNYIILLDLSDRLICSEHNQSTYDKQIVYYLFNVFMENNLNLFANINNIDRFKDVAKDRFQVVIADQKWCKIDKSYYENLLKFDFAFLKKDDYQYYFSDAYRLEFYKNLDELYTKSIYSDKKTDYFGADIWKFFDEDLSKYLVQCKGDTIVDNFLFIITDGYIAFENYKGRCNKKNRFTSMEFMRELRIVDWKEKFDKEDFGLIPLEKKFDNIKAIVLEINPQDYPNEFNLISEIWQKWLKEMNISYDTVLKHQSLGFTKKQIFNYIDFKYYHEGRNIDTIIQRIDNLLLQSKFDVTALKSNFTGHFNGEKALVKFQIKSTNQSADTVLFTYDLTVDNIVIHDKKGYITSNCKMQFVFDNLQEMEYNILRRINDATIYTSVANKLVIKKNELFLEQTLY